MISRFFPIVHSREEMASPALRPAKQRNMPDAAAPGMIASAGRRPADQGE